MGTVKDWIESQHDFHFCQCGCNKKITIKKHHFYTGIPKYLQGHQKRNIEQWIQQEQGKHYCDCGCGGLIHIMRHHHSKGIPNYILGHHLKVKNPNKGKIFSQETRRKISDGNKGKIISQETRKKLSLAGKGRIVSDETRNKISIINTGRSISEEHKKILSKTHKGKILSKKQRMAISKRMTGKNHPNFQGWISKLPYCEKFNEEFKEYIRDKFNRQCFLCDIFESELMKDQIKNGKRPFRLSVHHVNYDKKCLCDDSKCEFVPLCTSCHTLTNYNKKHWESLIVSKLKKRGLLNQA